MHGLVVRNTGYSYTVKSDAGEVFDCKVKGNFRIRGIRTTNPVAIGDRVTFTPYEQQTLPSPSLQGGSSIFVIEGIKRETIEQSISVNEDTNEEAYGETSEQSNHSLPMGRAGGGSATFRGTFVSMGNPHFVVFLDEDVEQFPLEHYGPLLEHHPAFPQRCNIEFAQAIGENTFRMRVWERGSGITLACGTGACATAVAAHLTGRAGRESDIRMDGGTLHIHWNETDNHVLMTGPAAITFEGEVTLP